MSKLYKPTDFLPFGKNKNYSLASIWKYQPTYISWLIINHDKFCVDIDRFRNLPKPTPYSVGVVSGSDELRDDNLTPLERFLKADAVNSHLSVLDIINFKENGESFREVDYWFPEEVLKKNQSRVKQFRRFDDQ